MITIAGGILLALAILCALPFILGAVGLIAVGLAWVIRAAVPWAVLAMGLLWTVPHLLGATDYLSIDEVRAFLIAGVVALMLAAWLLFVWKRRGYWQWFGDEAEYREKRAN